VRDIPVFATENGVGSLVLKEIPYKKAAYIKIHDSLEPEAFLSECVAFCKMVGAEHIYATGHRILESRPLYTTVLKMCASCSNLQTTDAFARNVTKDSVQHWRDLYNSRMNEVPGSAWIDKKEADELLLNQTGYFVYKGETLIGIGIASEGEIRAIASLIKGAGKDVLLALCAILQTDEVVLEVAQTNKSAMRLYEEVGFVIREKKFSWYKII